MDSEVYSMDVDAMELEIDTDDLPDRFGPLQRTSYATARPNNVTQPPLVQRAPLSSLPTTITGQQAGPLSTSQPGRLEAAARPGTFVPATGGTLSPPTGMTRPRAAPGGVPPAVPVVQRRLPGPAGRLQALQAAGRLHQASPEALGLQLNADGSRRGGDAGLHQDSIFETATWQRASDTAAALAPPGVAPPSLQAIREMLGSHKLPKLLVMVMDLKPSGAGDAFAKVKDPTGVIGAAIHHTAMQMHPTLAPGVLLLLRQVSVFSSFPGLSYLCVTAANVAKVVVPPTSLERTPAPHMQQHMQQGLQPQQQPHRPRQQGPVSQVHTQHPMVWQQPQQQHPRQSHSPTNTAGSNAWQDQQGALQQPQTGSQPAQLWRQQQQQQREGVSRHAGHQTPAGSTWQDQEGLGVGCVGGVVDMGGADDMQEEPELDPEGNSAARPGVVAAIFGSQVPQAAHMRAAVSPEALMDAAPATGASGQHRQVLNQQRQQQQQHPDHTLTGPPSKRARAEGGAMRPAEPGTDKGMQSSSQVASVFDTLLSPPSSHPEPGGQSLRAALRPADSKSDAHAGAQNAPEESQQRQQWFMPPPRPRSHQQQQRHMYLAAAGPQKQSRPAGALHLGNVRRHGLLDAYMHAEELVSLEDLA